MGLAFGLNAALPEGVKAAWGCRLIVKQDGHVDFLHDRQDAFGDEKAKDEVIGWLNGDAKPFRAAWGEIEELLRSYKMRTREAETFTVYEDERGVILANSNGSCGYCYCCAYLHEHEAG